MRQGDGSVQPERENWEGLWIGNNRKERHGLFKNKWPLQPNWIPETDNRTWSNHESIYQQDLLLLNQFWKTQKCLQEHTITDTWPQGLLWTAKVLQGWSPPRLVEGVPTSAEVSPKGLATLPRSGWKHRWLCTEEICTAAQFPGRVSTCQTLAELLNKANFSCQRESRIYKELRRS